MAASACTIDSCRPENDPPENDPPENDPPETGNRETRSETGSRDADPGAEPCTAAALARAVGLLVRALRKKRGLSQEELAWQAGLHRTRISQIERGIGNLTLATLQRLALALDVSLASLCPDPEQGPDPEPGHHGGNGAGGEAAPASETTAAG